MWKRYQSLRSTTCGITAAGTVNNLKPFEPSLHRYTASDSSPLSPDTRDLFSVVFPWYRRALKGPDNT
jgi:hypothetical protein